MAIHPAGPGAPAAPGSTCPAAPSTAGACRATWKSMPSTTRPAISPNCGNPRTWTAPGDLRCTPYGAGEPALAGHREQGALHRGRETEPAAAARPGQGPALAAVPASSVTREKGHGRSETRTLKAAHVSGLDFPHARQAIKITRWRQVTATGRASRQTGYAVTSLTSADATAGDLARLVREQWSIEAHHHVRSPGVPSLSHDVAPDALRRAFCNTSPWVWCSFSLLLRSLAVADPPHVQHLTWRRRVVDHDSTRMIR